jgi:hypothetical protein
MYTILKFSRVYYAKPRLTCNYFNTALDCGLIQQTTRALLKEVHDEGVR